MPKKEQSLSQKEQAYLGLMVIAGIILYQTHGDLKKHMLDCSGKSATLIKVVVTVACGVLIEIILRGLDMFHLGKVAASTM